jgi:hypothetical protein
MKNSSFWNSARVSTHFAISKSGEIVQLVNIFDTAWAQGRLGPLVTWPQFDAMGRGNPNGYLISTEHEDETELNMSWPEAMYEADLRLKRWSIEECRSRGLDILRFGIDSLAGHYMFDSVNRVNCPGKGWPRERLFADLTRVEGPEVYHQHDAWALEDLRLAGGNRMRIDARTAFRLPRQARRISIEWLAKRGYGLVSHGDATGQAGRFGWAQTGGYAHTPSVVLDSAGGFELHAEDPASPIELHAAHVTAWW